MNVMHRIALRMLPRELRDGVSAIGGVSEYLKWLQQNQGKTLAGVNVTEQTALGLSYAYSCINVLSQTLSHIPLQLKRKTTKGTVQATDHPLYYLLHDEPNPLYTSSTLRETMEGHRNGWGNCYARINRRSVYAADAEGLDIMYPDRTHPKIEGGSLVYKTQDNDGKMITVPAADVIHVHGVGFNGITGYSPISLLKEMFGLGLATQSFGNSFFGSGAHPSMVIETTGASHNQEAFRKEANEKFSGVENVGNFMVLPKGATAKAMQINPDDAQFLQTRQFNRTEVCGVFRVPPHFIGDLDKNTFTNAGHMDMNFVKHTMVPIFVKWEAELNRKLLTVAERKAGFFFQFNANGILRGAPDQRAAFYKEGTVDGWLLRSEVREFEDLPWIDGLDEPLLPVNMVPVNAVDMEPVVESVSYRLSKYAIRGLTDNKTPDAVVAFVDGHAGLARKIVEPLARALKLGNNFPDFYVARYRNLIADAKLESLGDSLSEAKLTAHFYGVLNEYRTQGNQSQS
jgi:HK97 family phage portal protein